ncbi:hypothetical protein OEZ86_005485 [Tetradesmus obliquus]|nr:hypothetical protein OEZ86_005485 [Tetradesmus obliquus]
MSGRKEQLIRTLSSRAETAPLSKPMFAAWLVAVVFVQFVWGLWAVCTRYMQTRPNPVAPTLQLLVVLNIIAWPSVVALVYLPNCTMRRLQQRKQRRQQQQTAACAAVGGCTANQDDAYVFTPSNSNEQQDAELGQAFQKQQQQEEAEDEMPQGWRQRLVAFARAQVLPSAIGGIACLYNLVNIYATKFTTSYLVQLMFMFKPLLVAISSSLLLRQPRAHDVYLTLLLMLMANRNITLLVFVPLALGIEGTEFAWLWVLKPMDIGVLVGSAIVIYTGANLLLQMTTRTVGANLVSVFISLRLVGSIVGEIVLLKDTPQHWLTWLGFGCVIVTMTVFLCYQQRFGRQHLPTKRASDADLAADGADAAAASGVDGASGASVAASRLQDLAVQQCDSSHGSKPAATADSAHRI